MSVFFVSNIDLLHLLFYCRQQKAIQFSWQFIYSKLFIQIFLQFKHPTYKVSIFWIAIGHIRKNSFIRSLHQLPDPYSCPTIIDKKLLRAMKVEIF